MVSDALTVSTPRLSSYFLLSLKIRVERYPHVEGAYRSHRVRPVYHCFTLSGIERSS
jgi:hypothetical protein